MAKYEYLIKDVDDTLLNFEKSESGAFYRTMEACKITPDSRLLELFFRYVTKSGQNMILIIQTIHISGEIIINATAAMHWKDLYLLKRK